MGLFSGLANVVKGQFSSKNLLQSMASGGLTTAHDFNKDGYHRLFPDKPAVPDAPPAPTMSDAEAAGEDKANQLRRRRGLAATVLAGSMNQQPTTRAASLLGS
jgi:hypothetical protein